MSVFGKRSPTPIENDAIERAGATGLIGYKDAGVTLRNAGASLFKRSGAQAILPDGSKSPIFRNRSNEVEKRQLLAWLEANAKSLITSAGPTEGSVAADEQLIKTDVGGEMGTERQEDLVGGEVTSDLLGGTTDSGIPFIDPKLIAGSTSVTPTVIYKTAPSAAAKKQEELAAAELRRQRQQRAFSKAERLRTRLEREGLRGGAGRRSLMKGSRGGIGFYSRFE